MKTLKMKFDELVEKSINSNNPIAKENAEYFRDYNCGRKFAIAMMQLGLQMSETEILEALSSNEKLPAEMELSLSAIATIEHNKN
jgi:hypothetical protein